jgi:hypothetical protein
MMPDIQYAILLTSDAAWKRQEDVDTKING